MATSLDLQEQEQLDALKAFWRRWGNPITWLLIVALLAYGGWNAWNWWQRKQAVEASALFDEFDRAAQAGDVDKTERTLGLLKERYPRTAFTQQVGVIGARVLHEKGKADAARAALTWVRDNAVEPEYADLARLRLAGLMLQAKQAEAALAEVQAVKTPAFEALAADRRGDILAALGRTDEARTAYEAALKAFDPKLDYRSVVDAKLIAIGPSKAAAAAAAASAPVVPAAAAPSAVAPASGASK